MIEYCYLWTVRNSLAISSVCDCSRANVLIRSATVMKTSVKNRSLLYPSVRGEHERISGLERI